MLPQIQKHRIYNFDWFKTWQIDNLSEIYKMRSQYGQPHTWNIFVTTCVLRLWAAPRFTIIRNVGISCRMHLLDMKSIWNKIFSYGIRCQLNCFVRTRVVRRAKFVLIVFRIDNRSRNVPRIPNCWNVYVYSYNGWPAMWPLNKHLQAPFYCCMDWTIKAVFRWSSMFTSSSELFS